MHNSTLSTVAKGVAIVVRDEEVAGSGGSMGSMYCCATFIANQR